MINKNRIHLRYLWLAPLIVVLFYIPQGSAQTETETKTESDTKAEIEAKVDNETKVENEAKIEVETKQILHVGVVSRPVFQYEVSDKVYSGLDVELGTAIADAAGYELELQMYPWSRIMLLLQAGKIDLTFSASPIEARKEFAWFTEEYLRHGHNKFYVLKENQAQYQKVSNLRALKDREILIGVQRGFQYSNDFSELVKTHWFAERLQNYNDSKPKIEALIKGRVDAFIGSEYGTANLLNQMDVSDLVTSVFYLEPNDLDVRTHMMFSKQTVPKVVVDEFDIAIRELRKSGDLQRIKQKYLTPQ